MPLPLLSVGDIAREVRDLLIAQPELYDEDAPGATPFKIFQPDPERNSNLILKEHLPQVAVREERSRRRLAEPPAGMGQALATFTLSIWLYAREYKSAEDAREFCRAAARNVETIFIRYPYGYPAGRWEITILGETEYLLVKLTDKFWGVAARVPLTLKMIEDVDEIRGC